MENEEIDKKITLRLAFKMSLALPISGIINQGYDTDYAIKLLREVADDYEEAKIKCNKN